MKLRIAQADDEQAISAVLLASYGTLLALDYDAETLAKIIPLIGKANPTLLTSGTYYVAEQDGQILACGGWTADRPGTKEVINGLGHIRHFATAPDHLGKGAAGMIMRQCLDAMRKASFKKAECYSTLNAVPFYERYGFEIIQKREVLVAKIAFPSVEMVLQL